MHGNVGHVAAGSCLARPPELLLRGCAGAPQEFAGEGMWLPGGGVNPGESLRAGALRECREEAGVEVGGLVGAGRAYGQGGTGTRHCNHDSAGWYMRCSFEL
jgi:ADP-ribose pyrophosphatase YjhB (NUDIX family)